MVFMRALRRLRLLRLRIVPNGGQTHSPSRRTRAAHLIVFDSMDVAQGINGIHPETRPVLTAVIQSGMIRVWHT